jgi:hypothetical protein
MSTGVVVFELNCAFCEVQKDVQVREQRVEKCSPGFNQLQRGPLHLSKIACQHSYRCVASTSEIGPKPWPLACQHHGFGWHCAVLGEKK